MSKLYRVIFVDEQLESLGISVGDICTQVGDFDHENDSQFHNPSWKCDGVWWLNISEVEEIVEGELI